MHLQSAHYIEVLASKMRGHPCIEPRVFIPSNRVEILLDWMVDRSPCDHIAGLVDCVLAHPAQIIPLQYYYG